MRPVSPSSRREPEEMCNHRRVDRHLSCSALPEYTLTPRLSEIPHYAIARDIWARRNHHGAKFIDPDDKVHSDPIS